MKKEILLGQCENEIYTAEIETEQGFKGQAPYFSITGTGYRLPFLTAEEGESQARESLEEGELWRMAVQAENTTESLEDWVERVLCSDGWEQTLGDIHQVGEEDLYIQVGSCGQCIEEILTAIKDGSAILPKLTEAEATVLYRAWSSKSKEELHLKPIEGILKNKKQKVLYEAVLAIFEKAPAFDTAQLKEYKEE